jgi:hypothetical protein
MTRKADFNADDWTTIVNGPLLAGMFVSAAERGGTVRELVAMTNVYQDARAHVGENEFVDALVASRPEIDPNEIAPHRDRLGELVTERLRAAVAAVEQHGTAADLDAYKTFVMTVAQAAASAHREGGLLGIGGRPISDAENAALDDIAHALGAPPAGAITPESE